MISAVRLHSPWDFHIAKQRNHPGPVAVPFRHALRLSGEKTASESAKLPTGI